MAKINQHYAIEKKADVCVSVLVIQSCPTLCNAMDCGPPGSYIHHGIFQAKILEWVAISFSRGFSQPRDQTWVSHIVGRLYGLSHQGSKMDILLEIKTFKSTRCYSKHIYIVQLLSHVQLCDPQTAACQASLSFTISWTLLKLTPLNQWCHPTNSSSVIPFISCLQSFPASGSYPMSQFFTSGGQSIGASASASVFPMTIQGWFPLELIEMISLLASLLIFSNTTVWKYQFFSTQPFL